MSQTFKTALIGLVAFAAGIMSSQWWQATSAEAAPHGEPAAQDEADGKTLTASTDELAIVWEKDGDELRFTSTDPSRSFLIFGSPPGIDDDLELPDLTFVFDEARVRSSERSMVFELNPVFDCSDVCLPCADDVSGCIDPRPPPDRGPIRWRASWMDPTQALPYDARFTEGKY